MQVINVVSIIPPKGFVYVVFAPFQSLDSKWPSTSSSFLALSFSCHSLALTTQDGCDRTLFLVSASLVFPEPWDKDVDSPFAVELGTAVKAGRWTGEHAAAKKGGIRYDHVQVDTTDLFERNRGPPFALESLE